MVNEQQQLPADFNCCNIRQVPIHLAAVNPVSHDKLIRNNKTDICQGNVDGTP